MVRLGVSAGTCKGKNFLSTWTIKLSLVVVGIWITVLFASKLICLLSTKIMGGTGVKRRVRLPESFWYSMRTGRSFSEEVREGMEREKVELL